MKRLTAMVLALLMLATAGMAEGTDLSVYDDDELVTLLMQVQAEIAARGIERTAIIPAGTYVCGRDIPAGRYVLASDGSQVDEHGIVEITHYIGENREDYERLYYDHRTGDEIYTVYASLVEGDELVLPFMHTLTISAGIMFQ